MKQRGGVVEWVCVRNRSQGGSVCRFDENQGRETDASPVRTRGNDPNASKQHQPQNQPQKGEKAMISRIRKTPIQWRSKDYCDDPSQRTPSDEAKPTTSPPMPRSPALLPRMILLGLVSFFFASGAARLQAECPLDIVLVVDDTGGMRHVVREIKKRAADITAAAQDPSSQRHYFGRNPARRRTPAPPRSRPGCPS